MRGDLLLNQNTYFIYDAEGAPRATDFYKLYFNKYRPTVRWIEQSI